MAIDLAVLRAEIALPQYAGLDEPATAAAINEPSIDGSRDVPASEARQIVLLSGDWAKTRLLSEQRPATLASTVAMTFVDTLLDRNTVIPSGARSQITDLLDVLVAANAISGTSKAALMSLFSSKKSRAEQLFGDGVRVDSGDISRAKAGGK